MLGEQNLVAIARGAEDQSLAANERVELHYAGSGNKGLEGDPLHYAGKEEDNKGRENNPKRDHRRAQRETKRKAKNGGPSKDIRAHGSRARTTLLNFHPPPSAK